ncbi:MAG TPA: hypothetical protein VKP30_04715 [Polyangiaceae bacterium]|nr:hypothetical protein [Polyangiaceae bacterium]
MKLAPFAGILAAIVAFSQSTINGLAPGVTTAAAKLREATDASEAPLIGGSLREDTAKRRLNDQPKPMTVLMRSGNWFIYSRGCETVKHRRDVVIHFHGAHTTVIPRFLASELDAVLVIVNLGLFSGPYTNAFALRSSVDGLLDRIQSSIAEQCKVSDASITRLALSSWSAGYGAVEQFLRFRPERVHAVLLADGLHVGFSDKRTRTVNVNSLDVFVRFAQQAARGERLMNITHSGIIPLEYAGAAETAMAVSQAAHAPTWTVNEQKYGMQQVTASRRGEFYVEGFAGNDKAAHSRHLYSIGKTSFARLREYWGK